jgi:nucleoside-diphosphate-sugar epimerase
MSGRVLVTGASGLIGNAVVLDFADAGWEVVALSRRPPDLRGCSRPDAVTHLAVDLRDEAAVAEAVRGPLADVTHVVYAAVHELPGLVAGWSDPEQMRTNLAMFAGLLDPLAACGRLEQVSIMQGTKAYGVHLHPIPVPARERYPRDDHANFYWLQEDHLRASAASAGFAWTIFRPTVVLGPTTGVAMNVLPVVGAYAALCRELDLPFGFPGDVAFPREAVDVRLIAGACRWAATSPTAADQHFNLTNGEVFSWRDVWPTMAAVLGVEAAPDHPRGLADFLPRQAATWQAVTERHGLVATPLADLLGESHFYADFCFGHGLTEMPPPAFVSTVKVKEAGFTRVLDTHACVEHWLERLVRDRVLPGR